jgi:hypothetical protein
MPECQKNDRIFRKTLPRSFASDVYLRCSANYIIIMAYDLRYNKDDARVGFVNMWTLKKIFFLNN